MKLAEKTCIACRGGEPPLPAAEATALLTQLSGWEIVDNHHLVKSYRFKNFSEALAFVNRVGAIADEQNHHPDVFLGWGKVRLEVWTHKIDGLTESDFIFAAKIDAL
jgi:4a-hydroxytetrahydrobiopterin dehydratase